MDLIRRLYENRVIQKDGQDLLFDEGRPEILFSDEKSLVEFSRFIQRANSHNDSFLPNVVPDFIDLFNALGIGRYGEIELSNIKIGSSKYNASKEGYCSLDYLVDSHEYKEGNMIAYYSSGELYNFYSGIKLSSGNESICCLMNHGLHIQQYSIRINKDVTLTREYYKDEVLFMFEGLSKRLVIRVKKPISIEIDTDYELVNEVKFLDYLKVLTYPYDMVEIYNKLCEISLGSDVSIYPEIIVCELSNTLSGWKDTNLISIKNGEIDSIIRTSGDKKISFDGNGNWNYMMSDENVMFTISSSDKISCSIETKNDKEMDDYTERLFRYDINTARSEVVAAKRLIREKIGLGCKREN